MLFTKYYSDADNKVKLFKTYPAYRRTVAGKKKSKIPKKENYFYSWMQNKINSNLIKTLTFSFVFVSANIFRTFQLSNGFFLETKLKIIH